MVSEHTNVFRLFIYAKWLTLSRVLLCARHYSTLTTAGGINATYTRIRACNASIHVRTPIRACTQYSRVTQEAYLEIEDIRNVLSVSGTLKYADSGTA